MSLRLRLALWYGGLTGLVVTKLETLERMLAELNDALRSLGRT